MKVISLLQPWASLVVMGAKKIETRSWSTKYRGPVLVHASKKKVPELLSLQCNWRFHAAFCLLSRQGTMGGIGSIQFERDLSFGAIVGMAEIVDCLPTENFSGLDLDIKRYASGSKQDFWIERNFGDYTPGRFGWRLSNSVQFKTPIPTKGSLGLWEYNGPLLELTDNQIRTCRICGCTDNDCRQCIEKTGCPCSWVAPDLCSACV